MSKFSLNIDKLAMQFILYFVIYSIFRKFGKTN